MKTVTIIGGGLAGLSLGIGLRQKGISVNLHEAATYPKHRVCGEFVCGVTPRTLENLSIQDVFIDAEICKTTGWYYRDKLIYQRTLPVYALGISRHLLDLRLSQKFESMGGQLFTSSRFSCPESEEGIVWASGRKIQKNSSWIGLSMHCNGMSLAHDLEIHLGLQSYVGLSRIENNKVNICGLFWKQPGISVKKPDLLQAYLLNSGLDGLCSRIAEAKVDRESVVGVSSLGFDGNVAPHPTVLSLGDHSALIPPFTGNGMSMALESAEIALDYVVPYAEESVVWSDVINLVQKHLQKRFKKRLKVAQLLHPFFCTTQGQRLLAKMAQLNLLPFKQIFRAIH